MESAKTSSWRLLPACFMLVVAVAAVAAVATWVALVPKPRESAPISIAAPQKELGTCLADALRGAPMLAGDPGMKDRNTTTVTVLSDAENKTTRVIYEGSTRLGFVVTITGAGNDSEAQLTTFPTINPEQIVNSAAQACARR